MQIYGKSALTNKQMRIRKEMGFDKFELQQGIVFHNIQSYMKQFQKNWDMICELHKLRQLERGNRK